ncbi:hypothetical protein ACU686_03165 [Yinghuangia aomiensis]
MFWSSDLQAATYERSRELDVDDVTSAQLRDIAETVRKQYRQESVLTFEYLAADAPGAAALIAEVPDSTCGACTTGCSPTRRPATRSTAVR